MRKRAGVRDAGEYLIQLVTYRFIGVIAIDEEQRPLRSTAFLPLLERDLDAIAAVQVNLGETANKAAVFLAGMLDVRGVRWQIDRMNFITQLERLVAFVKDPGGHADMRPPVKHHRRFE